MSILDAMKVKLDRKRQRRTSKQAGEDSEHEDHPKTKKKAVTLSAGGLFRKIHNEEFLSLRTKFIEKTSYKYFCIKNYIFKVKFCSFFLKF